MLSGRVSKLQHLLKFRSYKDGMPSRMNHKLDVLISVHPERFKYVRDLNPRSVDNFFLTILSFTQSPRSRSSSLLLCHIDEGNSCIAVPFKDNDVIASDVTENSTRDEQSQRMTFWRDFE
jgi:hypothetical protein